MMKFTNFKTFVLRQLEKNYAQYYNSYEEFVEHCESGEVTIPVPYMLSLYEDFKKQLPLSYSEDRDEDGSIDLQVYDHDPNDHCDCEDEVKEIDYIEEVAEEEVIEKEQEMDAFTRYLKELGKQAELQKIKDEEDKLKGDIYKPWYELERTPQFPSTVALLSNDYIDQLNTKFADEIMKGYSQSNLGNGLLGMISKY